MIRDPVATAHATLVRATGFAAHGLWGGQAAAPAPKVIGNGLRELDRFLVLLLDALAAALMPAGFDLAGFTRQTNAARKLARLRLSMALPDADTQRLRAIGRVRACLFHCGGKMHRADLCDDLEIAMGTIAPRPDLSGETLDFDAMAMARICAFYAIVGDDLLAACAPSASPH